MRQDTQRECGERISRGPLASGMGWVELLEQAFGVLMINLLEDFIGKRKAADFEAALAGSAPVVEVLVGGFEPSEIVAVHGFGDFVVGAEHHAILILQKQFAGAAGLAAEL